MSDIENDCKTREVNRALFRKFCEGGLALYYQSKEEGTYPTMTVSGSNSLLACGRLFSNFNQSDGSLDSAHVERSFNLHNTNIIVIKRLEVVVLGMRYFPYYTT